MRKSFRFLAAFFAAILFTLTGFAQSTTITGRVKNAGTGGDEGVSAVSVSVKGGTEGTYTDANGNFTIRVAKLPVTIVFSSIGFEQKEVTVENASTAVEVSFTPASTLGQEVVVATTRTPQRILEAPVSVERLSTAALRNVPAPSYYEAIANLKGVDMQTASLTFRTVTTRGFMSSGNTRLNQLTDGMDNQAPGLNFAVGSVIGLTELDVDNIELLSGASSALYGSGGINGTLLLNSKNPFRYQGVSFQVKQGVMNINNNETSATPYYDWSLRWGKAINDKLAIKISGQFIKARDWSANDYSNKRQIGVLSQVVPGNRSTDPNYNGVNVYGDEASANMQQFSQLVQAQIIAGVLQATGGTVNLANSANAYFGAIGNPTYPTAAQLTGFVGMFPAQLQPTVQQFLPFYVGSRNNYFKDFSVSRTGYEERHLVDYNSLNVKATGGIYYKITPGIEASLNTYFGTGTTVYTGADRYSLRNLKMAQHKLEVRSKSWFVRTYTTQENAGESYNASALGAFINDAWKANATWFSQYVGAYSEYRRQTATTTDDRAAHDFARATADQGRLMPGTPQYNATLRKVRSTPIKNGGALFLDKSDLYATEGQLTLSDVLHFNDQVEMIVGAGWKQWVLNSQGTIFADTAGAIKINEAGAFLQLKKSFLNDVLTLTAAGRYDKQTNFDGRFTPRFTAVVKVAKDNNVRLSYQTAYRFPTNQDQYISLVTGAGTLIGMLPEFQSYYKLNSTLPGYTPASILAYRASGNPNNTNLLVQGSYKEVKPETVSSYELGYRGLIQNKLLIDGYVYYSQYKDFLGRQGLGQSKSGNPQELYSPFTTTNISYIQNSDAEVKSIGWGLGFDYQLPRGFNVSANVFSDELRDVPTGFVSFFNAPKYRVNVGVRNENVYKNIGFNAIYRWQDENYYEGTFVTGTLPSFGWLDAQVSYKVPKSKSQFRLGGTNILNNYQRTGFGNPYVGGLYYLSYAYNL